MIKDTDIQQGYFVVAEEVVKAIDGQYPLCIFNGNCGDYMAVVIGNEMRQTTSNYRLALIVSGIVAGARGIDIDDMIDEAMICGHMYGKLARQGQLAGQ